MSQKFPLQSLLDLSQLRLDEAAKRLGELISGEQEAGKRLQLLTEYRTEYQARFVTAVKAGIGPKEWQNFTSFLRRLDEAVAQAGLSVAQSRQRTAMGQQEWVAKSGRVKAFDTLAQRHQSRLDEKTMRRDAKVSDEHTARRFGSESADKLDDGGQDAPQNDRRR